MSNSASNGLQITPLTLWCVGGLAAALWCVLFAQNQRTQAKQDAVQETLAILVTSQKYDRSELDTVKGDVKQVQADVRVLSDRIGRVEARK